MLHVGRSYDLCEADELGDRRHPAVLNLHEDILEGLRIESVFGRCGCHDTIDLTELVEVSDVGSTAVRPEGVEYVGW